MTPKSRKLQFFENIDAGEGFGHENRPNFFAGANFIACGAALLNSSVS